ncbi:uncharacterized protein LOC143151666 [Ptiloglossa arizonensis]|uniref:uncharacterized protein LOC143151666 n=1 Tax=Ptiloglossa arizonensis TaxID=3350558 RepID=UPI003FA09008
MIEIFSLKFNVLFYRRCRCKVVRTFMQMLPGYWPAWRLVVGSTENSLIRSLTVERAISKVFSSLFCVESVNHCIFVFYFSTVIPESVIVPLCAIGLFRHETGIQLDELENIENNRSSISSFAFKIFGARQHEPHLSCRFLFKRFDGLTVLVSGRFELFVNTTRNVKLSKTVRIARKRWRKSRTVPVRLYIRFANEKYPRHARPRFFENILDVIVRVDASIDDKIYATRFLAKRESLSSDRNRALRHRVHRSRAIGPTEYRFTFIQSLA